MPQHALDKLGKVGVPGENSMTKEKVRRQRRHKLDLTMTTLRAKTGMKLSSFVKKGDIPFFKGERYLGEGGNSTS